MLLVVERVLTIVSDDGDGEDFDDDDPGQF